MKGDDVSSGRDWQEAIQACLQELVELARRKQAVLLERKHPDLSVIVGEENNMLQCLEMLKAQRTEFMAGGRGDALSDRRDPRSLAKMAAAVMELQRLNGLNASLVQEHLDRVEMCLSLLAKALARDYTVRGDVSGNGKVLRGFVDMQA